MTQAVRFILAFCALAATTAVAAGCGGVPGNAVAEVDGATIEKSSFDHWMNVAAKSSGSPDAVVPDPPDYTRCIQQKQEQQPEQAAQGQPKLTDQQAKEQCAQEYETLRDQVVQLLVSYEWIQGEAEELGVTVSDREVQQSFDQQKEQSFPNDEDYQKFLRDSGQSEEDVKLRVRLDLLSNKIRDKVIEGKDNVTDQQIEAFYNENKERFAQPERRDLRIVLTKNEARAQEAKRALQSGDSWNEVADEFSIDEASKAQGGKLPAQAEGTLEQALDRAVFSADRGEIAGPVETQFGFYVFEVEKVQEASQQTLQQARETIRQTLQSQNQQQALDTFVEDFRTKWKERTECRDEFRTPDCKGAPDPTPTPAPAAPPQVPPGAGAPPQAPPGAGAPPQAPPGAGAPPQAPPGAGAPQAPSAPTAPQE